MLTRMSPRPLPDRCTAGGADGDLAAQWAQLDAGSDVLGLAPDDEVLAEMLALQSELAQQVGGGRDLAVMMPPRRPFPAPSMQAVVEVVVDAVGG